MRLDCCRGHINERFEPIDLSELEGANKSTFPYYGLWCNEEAFNFL